MLTDKLINKLGEEYIHYVYSNPNKTKRRRAAVVKCHNTYTRKTQLPRYVQTENAKGESGFVSMATIGHKTKVADKVVNYTIARLIDQGPRMVTNKSLNFMGGNYKPNISTVGDNIYAQVEMLYNAISLLISAFEVCGFNMNEAKGHYAQAHHKFKAA